MYSDKWVEAGTNMGEVWQGEKGKCMLHEVVNGGRH